MNAKRYVRYIVKELKCSSRRRREVRKELLSKLTSQSGETLSYDELRKEIGEIYDVINEYAPKLLSAEEVEKILTEKFADVIATGNKGQIMKTVMPELKGKADGKVINEVVAKLCG